MNIRTTRVKGIKVIGLSDSSIINIGDSKYIEPTLEALAVQKEGSSPPDDEFPFEQYRIFQSDNYFHPYPFQIIQEHIHHDDTIDVPAIEITAISSSSIVQLGNTDTVHAISKAKDIRIVNAENNDQDP
ncbi:spore germination protein GerPE [Gracilibacillus oryzae]|uniref:Spore germination protein GerPE n=1 Tax=Gracilibacillus oryzae TaxID=1672701 RepID=A0A7C8KWT7_9BACI|nr:spore germination protein GerPE [Gracilibacillus oryzae]KAB8139191.1 spore germination protein GerPE [Gracilibacillus oryzae]